MIVVGKSVNVPKIIKFIYDQNDDDNSRNFVRLIQINVTTNIVI